MKSIYMCEFCGKTFDSMNECITHEHSHSALFLDHGAIEDDSIKHSGYIDGEAPKLVYIPLIRGDNKELVYGRYGFITVVSVGDYNQLKKMGLIKDY